MRQIASVVNTVCHCRCFGLWLKLANNCKMSNKLSLSDTQNWHHWIVESSPSKAIYNTWLHIAEKFVLTFFKTWCYECRSSGLPYWNVILRWAATAVCRTEMVNLYICGIKKLYPLFNTIYPHFFNFHFLGYSWNVLQLSSFIFILFSEHYVLDGVDIEVKRVDEANI